MYVCIVYLFQIAYSGVIIFTNFYRYSMCLSKLVGSCVNGICHFMEMNVSNLVTENLALNIYCYLLHKIGIYIVIFNFESILVQNGVVKSLSQSIKHLCQLDFFTKRLTILFVLIYSELRLL